MNVMKMDDISDKDCVNGLFKSMLATIMHKVNEGTEERIVYLEDRYIKSYDTLTVYNYRITIKNDIKPIAFYTFFTIKNDCLDEINDIKEDITICKNLIENIFCKHPCYERNKDKSIKYYNFKFEMPTFEIEVTTKKYSTFDML